jgi:putative transposase
VVKPSSKRAVIGYLQKSFQMSQRRACRLIQLSRKAMNYQSRRPTDWLLRKRLKELGEQYPRYGYLLLHATLHNE